MTSDAWITLAVLVVMIGVLVLDRIPPVLVLGAAVLALLFAIGISLFVAAGLIGNDNTPDTALSIPGVEGLIPGRGDEVLQPQRVGIDLEPGFRLVSLTISPDAPCL